MLEALESFKWADCRNRNLENAMVKAEPFPGYCDHFTASARTTKPVVVQQLSFTVLLPAFRV